MPKIKNVTGEDRTLPWLNDRLVLAGQEIEVSDADVYSYTQQVGWDPADDDAEAITDKLAKTDAKVAEARASNEKPPGNASREDWAAYAVSKGVDPAARTRDEIRDLFEEK